MTDPNAVAERTPFLRRVACAALLHADTYEEVEADRSAIGQAAFVVLLSSLSIGVGSFSNGGTGGSCGRRP